MRTNNKLLQTVLTSGALLASAGANAQYSPTPEFTGKIGKTVEDTKTAYPQRNPQAPQGAPNVVWVLLDDVGFGATSSFGGLIETPTFDYLSQNGLRFNNFHTTSISAPTRAALLTGRNHHSSHTGQFNFDTYGAPGYDTYIPMENGTIAEVLQENGYNTFAVGKYNATPTPDGTHAGPFNRWPTHRGFDHFYGFNAVTACDDQWHPYLYRDTQREPDDSLGQLAITRFTNEAINFIADQKTAAPDKPFFLYFAPGTAHFPHQTTPEWINKYKGKFDDGWDEYAKKTLANQIAQGIVPANTKLPIRNNDLEYWNKLSDKEKKVFARQMETYAGFLSQADYEIGRLVDYLREINQLDNTIIIVAIGDNGAEAAGRHTGNISDKNKATAVDKVERVLDRYGDETTYPFYPEGWAAATNTPFRYYKGYADYEGGTHNGLIVFAPKFIKEKGAVRSQYTHVIDILPTTVELTGTTVPKVISGYKQNAVEGTSFAYAVKSADNSVEDQKHIQYYELASSYAIYKDGWKAQFPNDRLFKHYRDRGVLDSIPHLYNLKEDFNESKDLAKKYPEKVKELQEVFDAEARKYNVYPLKPWLYRETTAPVGSRKHFEILFGTRGYAEYPYFSGIEGHSYSLVSEVEVNGNNANGVLFSFPAYSQNFSFYLKDGNLVFSTGKDYGDYTDLIKVKSNKKVSSGKSTLRADIDYDQQFKNAKVSLYINNEKVAEKDLGNFGVTSFVSVGGPVLQIGRNWGVSLSDEYSSPFQFAGKYIRAYIDVK